jgi:hypothetical protein
MLELKLPFVSSLLPNPNGMKRWIEGETNTLCRTYHGLNSCGIDNLSRICIMLFQGSSGGVTCPRGSDAHLPAQGSSGGATWRKRGRWSGTRALSSGQLRGCHVLSRLRLPPLGSGQLRGRHVSPQLQRPPPGAGQLWGCHVSPRLRLWPPGAGQLRESHVSPRLRRQPPNSGQLRGRHGVGSHLPPDVGNR